MTSPNVTNEEVPPSRTACDPKTKDKEAIWKCHIKARKAIYTSSQPKEGLTRTKAKTQTQSQA